MSQVANKLKARKDELLLIEEGRLRRAITNNSKLTPTEETRHKENLSEIDDITAKLNNCKFTLLGSDQPFVGADEKYFEGFWKSLQSPNTAQAFSIKNAALAEGNSTQGEYLVPVATDPTIAPLAAYECTMRQVARVRSFDRSTYLPVQSARSTASIKLESNTANGVVAFGTSVPNFSNVQVGSYVLGNSLVISRELFDDVQALSDFVSAEAQKAILAQEEYYFTQGSGSGQPQGILGNVNVATGTGITAGVGALSIDNLLSTVGSLAKAYIKNASWICNRLAALRILSVQLAATQYQKFVDFSSNGDFTLFGFPVNCSYEFPTLVASPAQNEEWIFGDVASCFTIADRRPAGTPAPPKGTSAPITIRVLDQTLALDNQVALVFSRRVDSKVLISEACVQFSASS